VQERLRDGAADTGQQPATAVGLHPGLTATPDGFWNVVFPRYARALTDLGVSELLQQHYG
jgi:hypothetical protein